MAIFEPSLFHASRRRQFAATRSIAALSLDCRIQFKWILIVNIDNNNTAPSRAVIARQLQIELRCVSLGSEVSENRQVGGWHLSLLSYR